LGCEISRLKHVLDNWHTDGGEVVSLTCRPPFKLQEDALYSVNPRAVVQPEGLGPGNEPASLRFAATCPNDMWRSKYYETPYYAIALTLPLICSLGFKLHCERPIFKYPPSIELFGIL
jgi:hypothetical protein